MTFSHLQLFESLHEAIQSDDAELKTDGVQAFQRSISAYQEAGVPSQVNEQCFPKLVTKYLGHILLYNLSSICD
jgi:hypothetical protein